MIQKEINERIALFKILADSNRYRAIALLMRSKAGKTVGAIAEALGMSHSSVSHLLGVLHNADIVAYEKQGREIAYSIAKTAPAKRIARLMQTIP